MPNKSFIEQSKTEWRAGGEERPATNEEIIVGCMQRMATATEAMAGNYTSIQNNLDWYKKRYYESQEEIKSLQRKNNTLRGWITRLKNK